LNADSKSLLEEFDYLFETIVREIRIMSKVKPAYCAVLVDGWPMKSCIMLAVEAKEKDKNN
jgi:aerobic-type carbon monoxide dehydrogenase small subunit (CoxS/CutS family)